jgi:hypothetical protein
MWGDSTENLGAEDEDASSALSSWIIVDEDLLPSRVSRFAEVL